MSTDEQLLLLMAKDGDVDAFNRLVAIYQDAVYGLSLGLTCQPAVADDVTQETFILAFRNISKMRSTNFRSWLLRIARNQAYGHFRREGRRSRETSVDRDDAVFRERLVSDAPMPEHVAINSELRAALEHCIGALGSEHREIIVLIDVQSASYLDAAEICGINVGTVKSRLNRARMRVRDCLRTIPGLLPRGFSGQE